MLEIIPDRWTYSSDHFQTLLTFCEQLLKEEKAYVETDDAETMRKNREKRVNSECRNNCKNFVYFSYFLIF